MIAEEVGEATGTNVLLSGDSEGPDIKPAEKLCGASEGTMGKVGDSTGDSTDKPSAGAGAGAGASGR